MRMNDFYGRIGEQCFTYFAPVLLTFFPIIALIAVRTKRYVKVNRNVNKVSPKMTKPKPNCMR